MHVSICSYLVDMEHTDTHFNDKINLRDQLLGWHTQHLCNKIGEFKLPTAMLTLHVCITSFPSYECT